MLKPKIIIADEPVSMLDVSIRAEILELIKEIQQRDRLSIIYITAPRTLLRTSEEGGGSKNIER